MTIYGRIGAKVPRRSLIPRETISVGLRLMNDNDSTHEFPSPYAGQAAFLFRDTTPQEFRTTLLTLGARPPTQLGGSWLFPFGDPPLLEIDLIEAVDDFAFDIPWDDWRFYVPLVQKLGVREEDTLLVCVRVRNEVSGRKALCTFAASILESHCGVVRDSYTAHVWTREEIANNSTRGGRTFFEGT